MRKLGIVITAALMLAFTSVKSEAGLILSGTIGGVNFCATDNGVACGFGIQLVDTSALVGVISLNPITIGGVEVEGSLHTTQEGNLDILSSSSLSITNTTGGAIAFSTAIGATDFIGPIDLPGISTTGSGTWVTAIGSTSTYSYFADATNQQGADTPADTPGILVDTFVANATLEVDSFSHNGGPFPVLIGANPYSMTLVFNGVIVGGGSLISRGQSEIAPTSPVPEPASLLLLGTGLVGAVRYRKRLGAAR